MPSDNEALIARNRGGALVGETQSMRSNPGSFASDASRRRAGGRGKDSRTFCGRRRGERVNQQVRRRTGRAAARRVSTGAFIASDQPAGLGASRDKCGPVLRRVPRALQQRARGCDFSHKTLIDRPPGGDPARVPALDSGRVNGPLGSAASFPGSDTREPRKSPPCP